MLSYPFALKGEICGLSLKYSDPPRYNHACLLSVFKLSSDYSSVNIKKEPQDHLTTLSRLTKNCAQ